MKTLYYTFLIIAYILCPFKIKAQGVTIPDANFVSWLSNNGFGQCLQGNKLDTTCAAVLNAQNMNCSSGGGAGGIINLYGVQFFKSLKKLDCSGNVSLDSLPVLQDSLIELNTQGDYNLGHFYTLPPMLRMLNCGGNNLLYLPKLPDSLRILYCNGNQLSLLPSLPSNLLTVNCSFNPMDSLPVLPKLLDTLYCGEDSLKWLPIFPDSLLFLQCGRNYLSTFPATNNIKWLDCENNLLTTFAAFGDSLVYLNCDYNQINSLPTLPESLRSLGCNNNLLHNLPPLPNELQGLGLGSNQIDSLPRLPDSLVVLYCAFNNIRQLPFLPNVLQILGCGYNPLTYLPVLPNTLKILDCSKTLVNTIPGLPDSIAYLYVDSNPQLHCLPKLKRLLWLNFTATGITCLPDYGNITTSYPPLNTVPLCDSSNQYGCLYSGLTAVMQIGFSVYPNPAYDYCTLQLDVPDITCTATLTDITGRQVMSFKITNPATQIALGTLPAGLYFVKVSDAPDRYREGQVGVRKLVRE